MRKILALLFLFSLWLPVFAFAKQGCCSWHKGVAYCGSNGKYICKDGTESPTCTCGGSVYSKSYNNYKQPSYNYNSYIYPTYTASNYTSSYGHNSYDYCKAMYGSHAITKSDSSCGCEKGWNYIYTDYKYQCVSDTQLCRLFYGEHIHADANGQCICDDGYVVDGEKCELEVVVRAKNCSKIANSEFDYSAMVCYCKQGYFRNGYTCALVY